MSRDTFQKVRFTDGEIRKDVIYARKLAYKRRMIDFGIPALMFFLITVGAAFAPWPQAHWLALISGVVAVLLLVVMIHKSVVYARFCRSIQKQNIVVCRSILESAYATSPTVISEKAFRMNTVYNRRFLTVYKYEFKGGAWHSFGATYYTWTPDMRMSSSGLFNSSIPGDEFYLVIDTNGRDILYIYNTKFFDYVPSSPTEQK